MKTRYIFLLPILLLTMACEKDLVIDGLAPAPQQPAISFRGQPERTLPMKVWFTANPDPANPMAGWISGHATHLGKVRMEDSPYIITSFGPGPAPGQFLETVVGRNTAANGEFFTYEGSLVITFTGPTEVTLTGTVRITGGNGRFDGATGSVDILGTGNPDGGGSWTGDGTITFR